MTATTVRVAGGRRRFRLQRSVSVISGSPKIPRGPELVSETGRTAHAKPRVQHDPANQGEGEGFLKTRAITIDRVSDENAGAHDAE